MSARRKRDRVKSEGRKVEDEGLRPVAHAEVGDRRVHLREARGEGGFFADHVNPV